MNRMREAIFMTSRNILLVEDEDGEYPSEKDIQFTT